MSDERGFTLIELLIALFIFAMLAAAGASLLTFSTRAQAITSVRLDEISAERRLGALLANDLAQAVPRMTRNANGSVEPAFEGGQDGTLFRFVRAGARVSGRDGVSGLQHVEWRLANGRLERVASAVLDGVSDATPVVMAQGLESAAVRFRDKGEWRDDWTPTDPAKMPAAAELTLTRQGSAPVRRLMLVGVGR